MDSEDDKVPIVAVVAWPITALGLVWLSFGYWVIGQCRKLFDACREWEATTDD